MTRDRWLIPAAVTAAITVVVAVQVVTHGSRADVTQAGAPKVAAGADVLAGIVVVPERVRGTDYRRAAFGDAWDDDTAAPVVQINMQVTRPGGISVAEVFDIGSNGVQVTRLRRVGSNEVEIPGQFDILHPGDVITLVGSPRYLDAILHAAGRESPQTLTSDRHALDFRRITISQHQLAGHTIDELNKELTSRWGARISRVRRGDQDKVAVPDYAVERGDACGWSPRRRRCRRSLPSSGIPPKALPISTPFLSDLASRPELSSVTGPSRCRAGSP